MPTKHTTATSPATKRKSRIGSDFEDFQQKQGRLEESTALAMKRVLAWEFNEVMKKAEILQAEKAHRMGISRDVVRHLLDQNKSQSR
jgi:antitoxin HicB